jgi:prolyl-tRNA editing enzyme YbaK/EbsC (Cys-tRNA(Pro) deacylase)
MSGVIEYLRGRGAPFMVLPYPEGSSPEETAIHQGVDLDALVDTVVMESRDGRALMAVPATRELDLALAREALGDPDARRASPLELRYHPSGYVPGAWPPLGFHLELPLYADPAVADLDEVVFPIGEPTALVQISAHELFRGDPVVIVSLTKASKALEPMPKPEADVIPLHLMEAGEPSRWM